MTAKKPKRGRPRKPKAEVRKSRASCWLDAGEKALVTEAIESRGVSESALLRAGLRALGIAILDE